MSVAVPQSLEERSRDVVLITHANPEDNDFARWLAGRLIAAGYNAWVDIRSLRGGDDFWDKIEEKLRNEAIKQIVVVSKHHRKPGVKKELAIGEAVSRELGDPDFLIPIRVAMVPHGEFPPELLRKNALDALPTWAEILPPLLATLDDAKVPRIRDQSTSILPDLISAQRRGASEVIATPETLISNWFPITSMPEALQVFGPVGMRDQFEAWLSSHPLPHVPILGLAATFCDLSEFAQAGSSPQKLQPRFRLDLADLLAGRNIAPFANRAAARNCVVSLLRQHWNQTMRERGLRPFEFSSGEVGWFFPDGLVEGRVKLRMPNGHTVDRVMSGKFKDRRWHLCLIARPRLWPQPLYRVHANMVLSNDGSKPLPGKETQTLRRRLTKSWFNDKWRDLLLAGLGWIADGQLSFQLLACNHLQVSAWPNTVNISVTYAAKEKRLSEETPDGEISLSEEFDENDDYRVDDETDEEEV